MRSILPLFLVVLCMACGQTGQTLVSYPFFARGTDASSTTQEDYRVELDVAEIGIGPVYFCATAAASSDLCPTAVQEWADSATFDALEPTAQQIGQIEGTTGTIRSAAYDFAIPWFTSSRSPRVTDGAPRGHSAHFEGTATRDGITLRFEADVDLVTSIQGERRVQGQRVTAEVDDSDMVLEVVVDPYAWWNRVDFTELEELGEADALVVVPADSRAMNALVTAMTAQEPPSFEWSTAP